MSHTSITLAAATALAALVISSAASAGPVPIATTPAVTTASSGDAGQPAGDFLLRALEHIAAPRAEPLAATVRDAPATIRQSLPAQRNLLSASLRSGSDLFLWNFVAMIHAQQTNRTFDLVDTGLTALLPLQTNVVSPVPLPASIWLFLVGALGLAGARLTVRGANRPAVAGVLRAA